MARDGRPTKYTPELLEQCENYLENYETVTKDVIPSAIGMFLFINIAKTTGYNWANPDSDVYHEDFKDILCQCNDMQHQVLINKGLTRDHDASITKLVLGKHGYQDKLQQSVTSKSVNVEIDKSATPEEAARAYQTLMGKE